MEPGNFYDFSWPCNSSDCILVDTVQCPIMPHKSILLYMLSFIYIFIFVIGMIANSGGLGKHPALATGRRWCAASYVSECCCWLSVYLPDNYYMKIITSASNNETYCQSFYTEHSIKEWLISMELVSVVMDFADPFSIITIFYLMLTRAILVSVLKKSKFKDESQDFHFHADEEMEGIINKNKQFCSDFMLVENILVK
ncbi:Atypical chemokine receptor 3 [Sciurus carolinensis]|uniref:Atypical chemokine receptor 3 n=1 Tax=Sciurus carolinensis TaxID=30640 RepID=A0AA41T9Q3_SCICA|nr:Atypical chemokine receptor 3 [Sciurus carolinensis]